MFPPLNLWRAEWLKTTRQPFNRILLFVTLVFLIVFFGLACLGGLVQPQRFLETVRGILPFPNNITTIAQLSVLAGPLLAAVFMANSAGSEYTRDTWKMVLPRYGSRLAFLSAKIIVGMVAMVLLLVLLLALGIPISLAGARVLGMGATEPFSLSVLGASLLAVGVSVFPMLLYGTAAFFLTIATRSTIAGLLLSFLILQGVAMFAHLFGSLAIVMPYPHLPNLTDRLLSRNPAMLQHIVEQFGRVVSPWVSAAVILIYCCLFVLSACYLFQRRDVTGA